MYADGVEIVNFRPHNEVILVQRLKWIVTGEVFYGCVYAGDLT